MRFPLVTGQRYQAKWESIDADKKGTASALRCDVTYKGEAHEIAPEFSGKYLLVKCDETDEGQPSSSDKLAWLQDLNIFVPFATQIRKPNHAGRCQSNALMIRLAALVGEPDS
ncbi:hypothetical protein [Pantoea ananatis]|uniref:hypothetical protein n=1 Tax=Pantoea ananas TaxID=553 RepID=UPI001ED90352|nr:hypothetical protein [Pantoea ananatis]